MTDYIRGEKSVIGEILDFCKEFEQLMEFYRNLCRFCSKFVWRKSVWRKNDKYEVWHSSCKKLMPNIFLNLKHIQGFFSRVADGRRPLQMGLPFRSQKNLNLKSNMTTNIVTKVKEVSVNSEQVHLILSKYWGTNFHFCSVHYFSYFC